MKKLVASIFMAVLLLLSSIVYASDLSFGNNAFDISIDDKAIIIVTRNVTFKVSDDGWVYKKTWKQINDNEDSRRIMLYEATSTWMAISNDEDNRRNKHAVVTKYLNDFDLNYNGKDILEISNKKIKLKIYSCGQAEIETWKLLN